jgi:hypothetical protein
MGDHMGFDRDAICLVNFPSLGVVNAAIAIAALCLTAACGPVPVLHLRSKSTHSDFSGPTQNSGDGSSNQTKPGSASGSSGSSDTSGKPNPTGQAPTPGAGGAGDGNSGVLPPAPDNQDGPGAATFQSRILCEHSIRSWLVSFTSKAGPTDIPSYLDLVEVPRASLHSLTALSSTTVSAPMVSRDQANLGDFGQLSVVRASNLDSVNGTIDVLFAARRTDKLYAARHIFFASIDLIRRVGWAVALAPELEVHPGAATLARNLDLQLRSHESSVAHKFLTVSSSDGRIQVIDAKSLKTRKYLSLDPARHFFPSLDEARRELSTLEFDANSNSFRQAFYRVDVNASGSVGELKLIKTVSASVGSTVAGPLISRGENRWWIEVSKASLPRPKAVSIVQMNITTLEVNRWLIKGSVGAAIAPRMSIVKSGGENLLALAMEDIQRLDTKIPSATSSSGDASELMKAKVKLGQIDLYTLDKSKTGVAPVSTKTILYSPEAVSEIEERGLDKLTPFAIKSLFTSEDGAELYTILPGPLDHYLYKNQGGMMARVSQEACMNPGIVTEESVP